MNANCIEIDGSLTLDGARAVLEKGCAALARLPVGDAVFDLGQVSAVDSSALAVVFAWLREARASQHTLSFTSLPAQLVSLAAVYGVTDLLPLA